MEYLFIKNGAKLKVGYFVLIEGKKNKEFIDLSFTKHLSNHFTNMELHKYTVIKNFVY